MGSLVVTDFGDGTGGQATITGTNPTDLNYLFWSAWTGEMLLPGEIPKQYPWTQYGVRTGDGTMNLTLPVGYYIWQLLTIDSGTPILGNLAYQNLSDVNMAAHWLILEGVKNRITSLALNGIFASNIFVMNSPLQAEATNPGKVVLISPIGAETAPNIMNTKDDVGFPVLVGIVDPTNFESGENLPRDLKYRDQIVRALREQRLPGVAQAFQCDWIPDAVVNPAWALRSKFASFSLFRFRVRQARGLT